MKKIISIILSVILSVTVFFGCGTEETQVVRVNEVTHSVFYAPFYVAIEKGFFEENNITIELTNGGGSDKSMTALLTGQADIGFMGPETAVYVFNEGQEDYPVVFAQVTQRDGSFLVGKNKETDFSWENLKGASVIGGRSGGMPEMTLEYVLKKYGYDIENDLTLRTDVSFDLMGGAFMAGNDDYVALFEPSASTMENAGEGYIVASVGAETGTVAYTAMMATKSYISQNSELIQQFVGALKKGQEWVETHSDSEIAEAIAPSFPDSDISLITKVVANYKEIEAWKTEPTVTKKDFESLIDVITTAGIEVENADYSRIVDNSFAEKA